MGRRKVSPAPGPAPYGYAKNGQPRRAPIPTPTSRQTRIVKLPVKVADEMLKKKKTPAKISTRSPTPTPTPAGEELDGKTYFRLWSIKEHLEYHALALRTEDRDIVKGYELDKIAERLERAIKQLKKVVPTAPKGDATSPLSSPPQI